MKLNKTNILVNKIKKKKVIFIFLILLTILIGVFICCSKNTEFFDFNDTMSINNSNAEGTSIAIYVDENNTGDYTLSTEFPEGCYVLEEDSSYCQNGGNISYSTEDSTKGFIEITSNGADSCYLYFSKDNTLTCQILLNNGTDEYKTDVDGNETTTVKPAVSISAAKAYIESKVADFTQLATTDEGMYATADGSGISYYFRGAVGDNWVYFAGYYWRIIRIDAEGNVRMIYSGSTAPTSETSVVMTGTGTTIGTSYFNNLSIDSSKPYLVGYSYSTSNSTTNTVNSYTNGIDSDAKVAVDDWYSNYLATKYDSYIAEVVYCNDRTVYTDGSSTYTGVYATGTEVYYGSRVRVENYSPTLNCSNSNDGSLYKAALITADELMFAGSINSEENENFYLYVGTNYWTMSPGTYQTALVSKYAYVFYFSSAGKLSISIINSSSHRIRPVISLSANVVYASGDGTWDSPYEISMS